MEPKTKSPADRAQESTDASLSHAALTTTIDKWDFSADTISSCHGRMALTYPAKLFKMELRP